MTESTSATPGDAPKAPRVVRTLKIPADIQLLQIGSITALVHRDPAVAPVVRGGMTLVGYRGVALVSGHKEITPQEFRFVGDVALDKPGLTELVRDKALAVLTEASPEQMKSVNVLNPTFRHSFLETRTGVTVKLVKLDERLKVVERGEFTASNKREGTALAELICTRALAKGETLEAAARGHFAEKLKARSGGLG